MIVTICGQHAGDTVRCRTVHIFEAIKAWQQWLPYIMHATEEDPLIVGEYRVWVTA